MRGIYGVIVVGITLIACHQLRAAPSAEPTNFCGPFPTGAPPKEQESQAAKTCLGKFGMKPEDVPQALQSKSDKRCFMKCMLTEAKHMSTDGELMFDAIEKEQKVKVPSQYMSQAMNATKACATKSQPLKTSGTDKETGICDFANAFVTCVGESHQKLCAEIKGK